MKTTDKPRFDIGQRIRAKRTIRQNNDVIESALAGDEGTITHFDNDEAVVQFDRTRESATVREDDMEPVAVKTTRKIVITETEERVLVVGRKTGVVSAISMPENLGKPGLIFVEDPDKISGEERFRSLHMPENACPNCGDGTCARCSYNPGGMSKCDRCGKYKRWEVEAGNVVKESEICQGHPSSKKGKKRPKKRLQVEVIGMRIRKTFSARLYGTAKSMMIRWTRDNFGFHPKYKSLKVTDNTKTKVRDRIPDTNSKSVTVTVSFRDSSGKMNEIKLVN